MATVASHGVFLHAPHSIQANLAQIVDRSASWFVHIVILILYLLLFLVTLVLIGFIEIRQANMTAFNSLIAALEQRDANRDTPFHDLLAKVRGDKADYRALIDSLTCPGDGDGINPEVSKTCNNVRNDLEDHLLALSVTEDKILSYIGNGEEYYLQYKDGVTQQAPQIIPVLHLLDSGIKWLNVLARSPFEIMEMFLLVCMGALGGVIGVAREFVEKDNPSIRDLTYKPAMGAVVALGIYVLFRASQLFISGQAQSETAGASTSIFLLAGLGLASGVCASDAIGQIEAWARRLLTRSRDDREAAQPAATEPPPDQSRAAGGGAPTVGSLAG
jgi:hypothetical protein